MSDSVKNPPPSGPGRESEAERGGAGGQGASQSAPAVGMPGDTGGAERPLSSSGGPASAEPSWVRKVDPRLGQTFGKYRVEAVIGKGGMGLVYEGEDIILGRRVAIKFLPESLTENPKAIERFITEAQVAGRLNHPNIIAIYDIGQEGDNYYMVMELLNPISAANYIKERGPMHWTEATKVAADCCAALHAAHQVGLVHRDIKPDNILCSPAGNTKLVDFGLVKDLAYQASLTQTGVVAGTPLYMSPEQASDAAVDRRSDIYSLGATFFALLTARPPYLGDAAPQIMFKHCTAPTPDPREVVADIPDACVEVLMRAMSKAPEERYQTADEMRLALEAALPDLARRVCNFLVPHEPSMHNMRRAPMTRGTSLPSISALNPKATPNPAIGMPSSRNSMGNTPGPGSMTTPHSGKSATPNRGSTPARGSTPSRGSTPTNLPVGLSGQAQAVGQQGHGDNDNRSAHLQSRLSLLFGMVGLFAAMCTLVLVLWRVFRAQTDNGGNVPTTGLQPPKQPVVPPPPLPPIRVGVLHSLSGTMAISARPIVDATEMAFDEINATGGLLGRKVEYLLVDGHSENADFEREAERLITQEKVVTIFGGWTPSNRKTIKKVVEKYDHLLVFPSRDEGMEDSHNIVYNGATPNQQVLPAVHWAIEKLGSRRIFLIGSDGLLGHMSNELVKDALQNSQARVVGEKFVLLSETNFTPIIKQMLKLKPDVIFNIINGDSNLAFFRELRAAGIKPQDLPTISFSIGENEMGQFSGIDMTGDYLAWNYFEAIDRKENREFVKRFKDKYGDHRGISDPMEAAYFGVYLWAQAVRAAGTDDVRAIRRAIVNQSYEAPGGIVRVDPSNNHTWKVFRLGKIVADNRIEIVYSSDKALEPEPFPSTRTRAQWEALLEYLYKEWGNEWVNPKRPDLLKMPKGGR